MPNPIKNMTYLKEFCPVDPPNAAVYDFGMFSGAIESGILTKTDFLRKFSRCFWWGLRNLRSVCKCKHPVPFHSVLNYCSQPLISFLTFFIFTSFSLQFIWSKPWHKCQCTRKLLCSSHFNLGLAFILIPYWNSSGWYYNSTFILTFKHQVISIVR